jgi:PTH1 family peptidyl-tRNA hydrolase
MKLIVGLGNPGEKYARHRHNVGFMALDRIAERHRFGPWKKKFSGLASDGEIGGVKVMLLKPQTYMNESGRSVGEAVRFLKVDIGDLIVVYDEIDLAPGKLKVKTGGGNAGHNGLRSLSAHLDNDYVRVRIGVGHPGDKDLVASYVLHDFAKADLNWLDPLLDAIADCAPRITAGDAARFQTELALALGRDERASGKESKAEPAPEPVSRVPNRPKSSSGHPAGERMAKRQSALAENLKKWLSGKK